MKLLVVVVSALVLIVNGEVISSDDENNPILVFYINTFVDEYEGPPHKTYRRKFPKPERRRPHTTEAIPRREFVIQHIPARLIVPPETFKIPFTIKHCANTSCAYLCSLLDYAEGICESQKVCKCITRTSKNLIWRL